MRVVFDTLQKKTRTCKLQCVPVFLAQFALVGKRGATVILPPSEDGEHRTAPLSESVCLCLYTCPIVVCLDELWYEALCSINLLIRCPLCATRISSVHKSSYFRVLELEQ